MVEFSALPFPLSSWAISLTLWVVLLGLSGGIAWRTWHNVGGCGMEAILISLGTWGKGINYTASAVLFCIAIYAVLWVPLSYRVNAENVEVVFPGKNILVPLETIREAKYLDKIYSERFRKERGGGILACLGLYDSDKLGQFIIYATDPDKDAVLLETTGHRDSILFLSFASSRIVLTPEDPHAMLQALADHGILVSRLNP